MANGTEDLPQAQMATPPEGSPEQPGQAPPGWYSDPWVSGQRRYWTGDAWTADVLADSPGGPLPPGPPIGPPDHPSQAPPARARRGPALIALAMAVSLVVGFASVVIYNLAIDRGSTVKTPTLAPVAPSQPGVTNPPDGSPNIPGPSADPSQSALSGLVIRQRDVNAAIAVQPLPGGTDVSGQPTLDVCNGTFATESLRTGRLQVAAVDAQGNVALSTEAVLYANARATTQAFSELRSVAAKCPATPVVSPVGEPTVTTHFNAAPDASWPQTPTTDRLAFDFVTTDQSGQTTHAIAVYLKRGRLLMGVYFSNAGGPQPTVAGQTTVAGIVDIFARRIAQLPASAVSGDVTPGPSGSNA